MEPGRLRHPRPEIFPQGRRAGAPGAASSKRRAVLAVAPHRRRGGARGPARGDALRRRDRAPGRSSTAWPAPGPIGAGRAAISTREDDARAFFDEIRLHAGAPDGGAQLAAMVQHRAALGLWHRRPGAGPLLRRSPDRRAARLDSGLRAPAAARLLHPVGRRRPRQRRRHHGSVGARGAALQIRLGHRLQFLEAARRRRAALRRRQARRA